MIRLPIIPIACAMLALPLPRTAAADHISARITKGTIVLGPGSSISAVMNVSGPSGFSFEASSDSGNSDALCQPCQAGETTSVSTEISPAYFGTARYRGQTYTFNFDLGGGWISLNGPSFTLPAGDTPEPTLVEFTTPFTVGADSYLFLQTGVTEESHNLLLSGGGTATVTFSRHYDEVLQNYLYFYQGLQFDFTKDRTPTAR